MTSLQTQKQTTHNLQTDEQLNAYLLLTNIYAPELLQHSALHRWK